MLSNKWQNVIIIDDNLITKYDLLLTEVINMLLLLLELIFFLNDVVRIIKDY